MDGALVLLIACLSDTGGTDFLEQNTMRPCRRCYWNQSQLAKWKTPNQIIIQANKRKVKAFQDVSDKGQMDY